MSTRTPSNSRLKAAVSVSQMASMVGLSRARFYELVERGIFLPPVYSLATRRPLYLRAMQEQNIEVRRQQRGVNGEYVLFYESRNVNGNAGRSRRTPHHQRQGQHQELANRLLPQLQSLGLSNITAASVAQAMTICYPEGIGETAESEVLRTVYRRLRRQNDA